MKIDIGLLVLRVSIGSIMLFAHGWPKLINFQSKAQIFPDPFSIGSNLSLAMAVFSEVFCSVALILGLAVRVTAFPLLITMLTAAFIIHGNDPWVKKEFALLYAIPFLTLIFTGGGKFSIDHYVLKHD